MSNGEYEQLRQEKKNTISGEQLKSINFKDAAAYKKWLAYGHMNVPGFGKTPQKIKIAGKAHKVKHTKKK